MSEARSVRGARPAALVVVLFVVLVWGVSLDVPFARVPGFADWIGNMGSRISRNYLRYGIGETNGGQILNLEEVPAEDRFVYHGHPATMLLANAGVFALTGSSAPWAARLLPLLASILALLLLAWVLARDGKEPWLPVCLMAALPLFGAHATGLVFEAVALAWMLAVVLLWQHGKRGAVVCAIGIGGLVDYPVLYLAPFFALLVLLESATKLSSRLRYGLVLGVASVASLAVSVLHNAWASGADDWLGKIVDSFAGKGVESGLFEFARSQLEFAAASFTIPGAVLAVVAALWLRARLGLPAAAFAFAGVLHVVAFRGHAQLHDFWLWYFLPACAIAVAAVLQHVPAWPRWLLFVSVVGLGLYRNVSLWLERSDVPVRWVANDLADLFGPEVVLHKLRGPPGWTMEPFRGHPVLEADGLWLLKAHETGTYQIYLDDMAGRFGYLGRPQLGFAVERDLDAGQAEWLDRVFPGARQATEKTYWSRYLVWNIEPFLLDPAKSPELRAWMGEAECARLGSRARMFLVLGKLPAGTKLLWLDGRSGPEERFRQRTVRRAGAADLAGWEPASGWDVAAWPGTEWARRVAEQGSTDSLTVRGANDPVPLLRARR